MARLIASFETSIPSQEISHNGLTYIKRRNDSGNGSYAICSSDGRELAIFPSRELAFVTAMRNDLEILSVH